VVDCINGHLQGTKEHELPRIVPPEKSDTATITIRVFATAYEQSAMHNEVRVDPLNQIGEANENNNVAVQNTQVKSGGTTADAFNELIISKSQSSPDPANTARNAVVTYMVTVGNDASDPVVGVKVRDTLPAGAKYIQATGTNSFLCNQTGARAHRLRRRSDRRQYPARESRGGDDHHQGVRARHPGPIPTRSRSIPITRSRKATSSTTTRRRRRW
jgi:uncharacterized repeat protein (TIGR01451 family)